MNRRDVLRLGAAAPLARLAGALGLDVPRAADAVANPEPFSLAAAEATIVAPLPSRFADADALPVTEIAQRLGPLRIDVADARTAQLIRATGEHAQSVRLFRRTNDAWQRVVQEPDGTFTIAPDPSGPIELGVAVVLPQPSVATPEPMWPRAFEIAVTPAPATGSAARTGRRYTYRVAPFIIPSSLEHAEEIWVVSRSNTQETVRGLEAWAERAEIPLRVHEAQDPCDQWMQDTMEPGVFAMPAAASTVLLPAVVTGMRAGFGQAAAGLDLQMKERLRERGDVTIETGVPREESRWIDWFGNIEVSPPHTDRSGRHFPFGRIITGRQRELVMHPAVMKFFEAQGVQWPPIVIDTSWLLIGHVDEVINFVPARTSTGYKVLLPSPRAARDMLERLLAEGHGDLLVFADTRDQTTVRELRDTAAASDENAAIDATIAQTREQLMTELNLGVDDFVMVPCPFQRGRPLVPNAVNCLVANGHIVASEPRGPRVDGVDRFEVAIRDALAPCDARVTFVDAWRGYHQAAGEVHCGTNAFRRLRNAEWWKTG